MNFDRILYCFNSDSHLLFEVKYRDPDTTDKSKLYKWYLYDSGVDNLIELDFVSMIDQKRIFKQGELEFDDKNAFLFVNEDCQEINFKSMRFHNLESTTDLNNTFINVLARSVLSKYNK